MNSFGSRRANKVVGFARLGRASSCLTTRTLQEFGCDRTRSIACACPVRVEWATFSKQSIASMPVCRGCSWCEAACPCGAACRGFPSAPVVDTPCGSRIDYRVTFEALHASGTCLKKFARVWQGFERLCNGVQEHEGDLTAWGNADRVKQMRVPWRKKCKRKLRASRIQHET